MDLVQAIIVRLASHPLRESDWEIDDNLAELVLECFEAMLEKEIMPHYTAMQVPQCQPQNGVCALLWCALAPVPSFLETTFFF